MMRKSFFLTLLNAVLFTVLFYNQSAGINFLLFTISLITSLFVQHKIVLNNQVHLTVVLGAIVSSILVVLNHSSIAVFMCVLSWFLLVGIGAHKQLNSLVSVLFLSVLNSALSFVNYIKSNSNSSRSTAGKKIWRVIKLFIIPLFIVFVFILIYKASNPLFNNGVNAFTGFIDKHLGKFFKQININVLLMFVLGLLVSVYVLYAQTEKSILAYDSSNNNLIRKRKKTMFGFNPIALKNEVKSAVFLLLSLNILIAVLNVIDIYWVWFNFEWNGDYLKQFVHTGTYLLIVSIIISLVIALYFFRGNINFYKHNKVLKILTKIWLYQNAILVISVGVRNYWYMHHFSLAYKRIGVVFFLLYTIYAIITAIVKINKQKSAFYLLKKNSYAAYILLLIMALFNWDIIIAKYNFKHHQTSFVELDFMSKLSNKALPFIDLPLEEVKKIKQNQTEKYRFKDLYMSPYEYYTTIQKRKIFFVADWETKHWLSWNFAEKKAYKTIKKPLD